MLWSCVVETQNKWVSIFAASTSWVLTKQNRVNASRLLILWGRSATLRCLPLYFMPACSVTQKKNKTAVLFECFFSWADFFPEIDILFSRHGNTWPMAPCQTLGVVSPDDQNLTLPKRCVLFDRNSPT